MSVTNQQEILDLAKKVVARAAKAKFSLTPQAYCVWFGYYEGTNGELIKELGELEATGKAFTEEIHDNLYKKYFLPEDEEGVVAQVQEQTQHLLEGVLGGLLDANKNTAQFGGQLGNYAQKLKKATKVSDVQGIMKNLLQDTAQMAASSKQLESKLEEATKQAEALRQQLHQTEEEATRDGLTKLHNRKAFDGKLAELFDDFKKGKGYFSVVFLDIDFFKKFNDTYGHQVGDLVLQTVGGILHNSVKGSDFPARYGGEEFIVLLPSTVLENAKLVAEQLRVKISVKKPKKSATGEVFERITASLGVSQVRPEDTPESVVARADKALYFAKESGRNNVKTERELL